VDTASTPIASVPTAIGWETSMPILASLVPPLTMLLLSTYFAVYSILARPSGGSHRRHRPGDFYFASPVQLFFFSFELQFSVT
jgi:hypothetical protein